MEILATSRLLRWEGKQILNLQFNHMSRLGLVTVNDVILVSQRRLMAFRTVRSTFRIPKGYTFIWDNVEIQAQHRPDRLKKPRTESVGTDRLGRVPSRLGPIG